MHVIITTAIEVEKQIGLLYKIKIIFLTFGKRCFLTAAISFIFIEAINLVTSFKHRQYQMMCPTKGQEIETKRNKSVGTKSGANKTSALSSKSSAVFSRLVHIRFFGV